MNIKESTLIDGKKISAEIKKEIKTEVKKLEEIKMRAPGLAVVIVGENKASQIYVNAKIKACHETGINSYKIEMSENSSEIEISKVIQQLNTNKSVDGILVQLPLPKGIDEKKIMEMVSSEKDVDCFSTKNIGEMFLNPKASIKPCTPAGIMELFDRYNIELVGKNAVILGRSNIVGKPLSVLMINAGATVTVCNSKTKNLEKFTKNADIVISAVGQKDFLTDDMITENTVVIDVGINRVDGKIYGDVDYENVSKKASFITPVPGGVGPMTIAMLLKNTLNIYKQN
ncbi:MAG: bifunctional methylenetetrahydrofolate dehydrogenase/methenyltetrahydrofolate cyclohydrolase FolD [Fusobacteriaceae bacterium]